jgi:hypothetical protein
MTTVRDIRLSAVTRIDRTSAMLFARDSIIESGGYISDIRLYSNSAECITFEATLSGIQCLNGLLAESGFVFSEGSGANIGTALQTSSGARQIQATLQIIFVHNDPDLRIEVPPIPG